MTQLTMGQYQAKADKVRDDFERRIDEATSPLDKRDLQVEMERELENLGRGVQWRSPFYSEQVAAMSDEDLKAAVEADRAKAKPGVHNPEAIRERQEDYLDKGPKLNNAHEVAEAMRGKRTPAEIAEVMERAGLTARYM